jgi:two-component system, OmpR family, response regulator RegX3
LARAATIWLMRVLLVEDEDSIAEPLSEGLRREGLDVTRAASGEAALDEPLDQIDAVLLDLRLPGVDGFEVCRRIRQRSSVPIIMTTARGEEIDKVLGLELGADDYVVKPFGVREIVARLNAVMRRARPAAVPDNEPTVVGSLRIDHRAHRAWVDEHELDLTPTEFALLRVLATEAGNTLTRQRLLQDVWNTSWTSSGKTVDVHVAALRRKLGDPGWIQSVRGVGYRLNERS